MIISFTLLLLHCLIEIGVIILMINYFLGELVSYLFGDIICL